MTEDKIVALAEFVAVDLAGQHLFVEALLEAVVGLDSGHWLAIPVDSRVLVDLEANSVLGERLEPQVVGLDQLLKREAVDFVARDRQVAALTVSGECFVRVTGVDSVD